MGNIYLKLTADNTRIEFENKLKEMGISGRVWAVEAGGFYYVGILDDTRQNRMYMAEKVFRRFPECREYDFKYVGVTTVIKDGAFDKAHSHAGEHITGPAEPEKHYVFRRPLFALQTKLETVFSGTFPECEIWCMKNGAARRLPNWYVTASYLYLIKNDINFPKKQFVIE
jgi:hypothetical protein